MKEEISNNKFLLAIIVVAVIGIIVVIILMINNGNEINVYDYYYGNQREDANLAPTFYAYGTEDPFYNQMNASVDALEEAGVSVSAHVLEDMPHGFGVGSNDNQWINPFDEWLSDIFED